MIVWIGVGLAAAVLLWGIAAYNRLVTLKNQSGNAWKQIDVQLKRRHDLIPNLVSTVKGVMNFEQQTLQRVIEARNSAVSAKGVADVARKEQALTGALGNFFALMEQYPQLKSHQNVLQLQEELASTENKIGFARQFFNDITTRYNIALEVFPSRLIASLFAFKPSELFEVKDAAQREVPKVDLG